MKRYEIALTVLISMPLWAHHNSGAQFDLEQERTIEGEVVRYEWVNPHVYIYLVETDAAGQRLEWEVEAGPVALMKRMGWSKETLAIGESISITGNPGRQSDKRELLLKTAERGVSKLPPTSGEKAAQALTESSTAFEARDDLAGTWVTLLDLEDSWLEAPEAQPLTARGREELEGFDESTMHPGITCTPYTAPLMMMVPDTKSIEIGEGVIWIRGEFDGVERAISLQETSSAGRSTLHGRSTAVWQGDSLIITTVGFTPHRMGNGFGIPSGTGKRLVERLELNDDRKSLIYHFTLEDPAYLMEPVEGQSRWVYRPDLDFSLRECDPENSARFVESYRGR